MDELIMRMKDLLDSKLKIAKIQYGTHLVDPTPDDIQKKDFNDQRDLKY